MALIAVDDIGAFAALAFTEPDRYLGRTVELAGDVLTPTGIAETFGRVTGVPARFRRTPIDRVRAVDEQLALMFTYVDEHPAAPPDLDRLRAWYPGLMSLSTWLRTTGWRP
jgi:uncharacterized protein YbjT (DUF2867 family)